MTETATPSPDILQGINKEIDVKRAMTSSVARVLAGSSNPERFNPDNVELIDTIDQQRIAHTNNEQLALDYQSAETVSKESRADAPDYDTWKGNLRSWVVEQTIDPRTENDEKREAFKAVGLLSERQQDGEPVYQFEGDAFFDRYLEGKADIEQFVKDISEGCKDEDGTVDLKKLTTRLTAVEPLFNVFGTKKNVNLLVKDYVVADAMLAQKDETRKYVANETVAAIQTPPPEPEKVYLRALHEVAKRPPAPEPEPRPEASPYTKELELTAGDLYFVGRSEQGKNHKAAENEKPNQDAIAIEKLNDNGTDTVMAVSDGHGGATYYRSDLGSQFAVEVTTGLFKEISGKVGRGESVDDNFIKTELIKRWRQKVEEHLNDNYLNDADLAAHIPEEKRAEAKRQLTENPFLAYGATIVAAATIGEKHYFLRLGDGEIVIADKKDGATDVDVTQPVPSKVGSATLSLAHLEPGLIELVSAEKSDYTNPQVLITTDGVPDAFTDNDGFLKVASDLYGRTNQATKDSLPGLLKQSTEHSGDDVTLAISKKKDAGENQTEEKKQLEELINDPRMPEFLRLLKEPIPDVEEQSGPDFAGKSIKDKYKSEKEDSFLIEGDVLAVFDGLGGGAGSGAMAAKAARNFIRAEVQQLPQDMSLEDTQTWIDNLIKRTHLHIFALREADPSLNVGETTVALMFNYKGTDRLWTRVGDSNLYDYENGKLEQLTLDPQIVGLADQLSILKRLAESQGSTNPNAFDLAQFAQENGLVLEDVIKAKRKTLLENQYTILKNSNVSEVENTTSLEDLAAQKGLTIEDGLDSDAEFTALFEKLWPESANLIDMNYFQYSNNEELDTSGLLNLTLPVRYQFIDLVDTLISEGNNQDVKEKFDAILATGDIQAVREEARRLTRIFNNMDGKVMGSRFGDYHDTESGESIYGILVTLFQNRNIMDQALGSARRVANPDGTEDRVPVELRTTVKTDTIEPGKTKLTIACTDGKDDNTTQKSTEERLATLFNGTEDDPTPEKLKEVAEGLVDDAQQFVETKSSGPDMSARAKGDDITVLAKVNRSSLPAAA